MPHGTGDKLPQRTSVRGGTMLLLGRKSPAVEEVGAGGSSIRMPTCLSPPPATAQLPVKAGVSLVHALAAGGQVDGLCHSLYVAVALAATSRAARTASTCRVG